MKIYRHVIEYKIYLIILEIVYTITIGYHMSLYRYYYVVINCEAIYLFTKVTFQLANFVNYL